MNSEWQNILAQGGLEGERQNIGRNSDSVVCPLVSEVVLHVTGEDAESFLQAQFSNDISALEQPGSHLTTWSSPKGRVITLLRVVRIADGFLLRLPAELIDPVLKRLRMYVLMAKVTIEQRDDLLVLGFSGANAADAMAGDSVALPEQIDATQALPAGGWITRVRTDAAGLVPRFEVVADRDQMIQHLYRLQSACVAADESVWRLQNIDAGIPSIRASTTEAFVLQMLNLQHINGVSFKKGCFPGQEVVARMQYLGKLKRQMYRLHHDGNAAPAAGDEIYTAGRESAVGKIVDAASAAKGCRMLAVIAIAEITEPLFLDKERKQTVASLDLPYETPMAN